MMTRHTFHPLRALVIPAVLISWSLPAQQSTAPAQQPVVFRVEVVGRTTKAISYHHRQGSTEVAFEGTSLAPKAKGTVKVDSKTGATKIDAYIDRMPPATSIGEGYLTYVLWAITPEGRAQNLGELMIDGDDARLQAATELQTFGMIVTAEPYYAVTQPSDYVVAEAIVKSGSTTGTIMPIEAKYELVAKGGYLAQLPPADRVRLREAKNIPLDLMEARQAMAIAKAAGADVYAADTIRKAEVDLRNAESFLMSNGDKKKIQTLARHVTQLGEDARLISVRRAHEEALAAERASLEKTAQDEQDRRKRAEDEAAARQRQAALADEQAAAARQRELQNQQQTAALVAEKERQMALERERAAQAALRQAEFQAEAEKSRLQAEAARREEARVREEALARQRSLEAETARAREAAERAEAERAKMRAELARQLNVVLATRETARGLIVNMSDVLFDTGMHTLRPAAREKLSRISGIIQVHPDMKIEVEGHTDSVGSAEFNQRLSEKRADSVRTYLITQGVDPSSIVARGFGESMPVADNNNAAGRQQNRRVELVVNGPMINKTTSQNGGVSQ